MTPIHHEIYTFHVIGPVRNSFAHMLSSELLSGRGELRGTLAQGRDLARLLNSPIDLLDAGHTAFHINPDGRMPCESDQDEIRSDLEMTTPLSAAARDQLEHLAGEVRQQLDAGRMPNGNDLDRLARWAQQAARYGVADADLEAKIAKQADYITDLMQRLEMSSARWTEWAAKILAAYPWVDEFKPEDSDEKYRDGVRYVLLCVETDGSGSEADNQEMKAIRDRWGFS